MKLDDRIWLHLLAIFSVMTLFGMATNRLLLLYDVHSMVERNLVVLTASYCAFFILLRTWLDYLESVPRLLRVTAKKSKTWRESRLKRRQKASNRKKSNRPTWWEWILNICTAPLDITAPFIWFIIVVLCVLIFGIWLNVEGPVILCDIAFEVALSVGLVKASRRIASGRWHATAFKRTAGPFLLVLVTTTLIAIYAETTCPDADRLSEVVEQCWLKHKGP